jgi:O-antigen ligase
VTDPSVRLGMYSGKAYGWAGCSLFYLCAVVMASSLFFGGGTRAGLLSDTILQLLSIPLLLVALWRSFEVRLANDSRWALRFCFALACVPILQLVPLPPALWTTLSNRGLSAEAFTIVREELPWMAVSVSPRATWLSALSLVTPLAILVSTLLLSYRERRLLSLVILGVGILSVFVGLIQVAQGPSSPLRFFAFTNSTEAVGFFANRNHFAALLYCLTLLAAAWAAESVLASGRMSSRRMRETAAIGAIVGGFTVLVVLIAAQAMARSRAGLALTIVALFGAIALTASDRRGTSRMTPTKVLFGAIALAVTFTVQLTLYRIMERFAFDPLEDGRIRFAHRTIEAARAYMPLGSGMGTFVPVYATFERPEDAVAGAYVNHAHNDVLELWLEAGVAGASLGGLFAIWLMLRSVAIWRHAGGSGMLEIDLHLARAATMMAALLLAHSFVDYPLRTGALMALMAFACALLLPQPIGAESRDKAQKDLWSRRSGYARQSS